MEFIIFMQGSLGLHRLGRRIIITMSCRRRRLWLARRDLTFALKRIVMLRGLGGFGMSAAALAFSVFTAAGGEHTAETGLGLLAEAFEGVLGAGLLERPFLGFFLSGTSSRPRIGEVGADSSAPSRVGVGVADRIKYRSRAREI